MSKYFKIVSLFSLFTLTGTDLFPQINSPSLGMATGPLLNVEITTDDPFDETIFSFFVAPSFRIKRTEFFAGAIIPLVFPSNYGPGQKFHRRIGATASYRVYILNPSKPVNLILQYEFQYISYSTAYDSFSGWSGTSHRENTYKHYNSLFGVGFIGFFNRNHTLGFSTVISYMFPVQRYQGSTDGPSYYYEWGHSHHLENYINYCFSLYVKLFSFKRNISKDKEK